jgi:hypothetical protein
VKHCIALKLLKTCRVAIALAASHVAIMGMVLLSACKASVQSTVASNPTLPAVQRVGVTLGGWAFYGSSNFFQNILMNPGFEPGQSGRVVSATSPTSSIFCDSGDWAFPSGFYAGATFQDDRVNTSTLAVTVVGTGTITAYNPTGCRGSPQFTYSANFTISSNDQILINQTGMTSPTVPNGCNPGSQGPICGPIPGYWWPNDTAYTTSTDADPNHDGVQSLQINFNGNNGAKPAPFNYGADPPVGTLNFFPVTGPWQFSIYAKNMGATSPSCTVSFSRSGVTSYFNYTFAPTDSWAQYTMNFNGTDMGSTALGILQVNFACSASSTAGAVRLDDAYLGPATSPAGIWRPAVINALGSGYLHVGYLRDLDGNQGTSYANKVADQWARQLNTSAGPNGVGWHYSMPDLFSLASQVGARPWVVIPVNMLDADYTNLGKKIATLQTTYNFPEVLIEFGNEDWNPGSCGGNCFRYNGGIRPEIYFAVAKRAFGIVQAGAGTAANIHYVGGGAPYGSPPSAANLAYSAGQFIAAPGNTLPYYIAGAPYYNWCQNASDSQATKIGNLFNDPQGDTSQANIGAIVNALAAVSTPMKLSFYEAGPSTLGGSDTTAGRLSIIAGAASGSADAALYLRSVNAGVPVMLSFQLSQVNMSSQSGYMPCTSNPPGGTTVPLWGMVYDLDQPILRPRGLALQLLNNYAFCGDGYGISDLPSGIDGAAFLCSDGWHLALVNENSNSQNVTVSFPKTAAPLPEGTVEQLDFSAVTNTNEGSATGVTVGTGGSPTVSGNAVTVPMIAYGSAVVLPARAVVPTPLPSTPTPTPNSTAAP